MTENQLTPTLTIRKSDARRFLLAYHFLWPPRHLSGKEGALQFMRRVRCVQFDPVNVVGWNPDLVFQSRVKDYTSRILDELLYADRLLWDGFDKVQSIYLSEDWPAFARRRDHHRDHRWFTEEQVLQVEPLILAAIRERGPLSSIDLEQQASIDGFWGVPIRAERAALEDLYNMGAIGIHHRVGTRRYFDLTERLLPPEICHASDPNETLEDYQRWHILRRIASLGLGHASATEAWQGIIGVKGPERRTILADLVRHGDLLAVEIEEIPRQVFFLRSQDADLLDQVIGDPPPEPRAALLAPLDNILWDRALVRRVFDFDYVWEVYKPAEKRTYGHYVLPVLYGERFIARCEPLLDRKANQLVLRNWWWETDVQPDEAMLAALRECLAAFRDYLEVGSIRFEEAVSSGRWPGGLRGW
jgi:hypothetical protein